MEAFSASTDYLYLLKPKMSIISLICSKSGGLSEAKALVRLLIALVLSERGFSLGTVGISKSFDGYS